MCLSGTEALSNLRRSANKTLNVQTFQVAARNELFQESTCIVVKAQNSTTNDLIPNRMRHERGTSMVPAKARLNWPHIRATFRTSRMSTALRTNQSTPHTAAGVVPPSLTDSGAEHAHPPPRDFLGKNASPCSWWPDCETENEARHSLSKCFNASTLSNEPPKDLCGERFWSDAPIFSPHQKPVPLHNVKPDGKSLHRNDSAPASRGF